MAGRTRHRGLLAGAVLFALVVAGSQSVQAHGELLIRIADATRQIEAATNRAELYLARGELYREDQNWAAAEADYARAAQLDPRLAAVDFCRAKMLADAGRLQPARALFDKVVARSPDNGGALIGRARVLVRLDQRKLAIADFQRALKLLPAPEPECFLELAQALVVEQQLAAALRGLDDGIGRLGPIVTLQAYAVELELERKNYEAAVARLDTIIGPAARKENWLARRGEILLMASRPTEARDSFEAALLAIGRLPLRLQQLPHMLKLQARINAALIGIMTAPGAGTVATKQASN